MYKIVIPSYKREKTIIKKTLNTLHRHNINPKLIYIFVANKDEYNKYKKIIPTNLYYKIIIGKEGLAQQRNFIINYFQEGERILNIDDDIDEIYQLQGKKLIPCTNLHQLIKLGFKLCKKYKTKLLGIYPVQNSFFMDNSLHVGLYYIVGCLFWNINTHDKSLKIKFSEKEDFYRSIIYYKKFGKLLRFDNITIKTNYYTEKGGMQENRTEKRVTKYADYLVKKYPQYCTYNTARKKHTEIKFLRQKNNKKIKF